MADVADMSWSEKDTDRELGAAARVQKAKSECGLNHAHREAGLLPRHFDDALMTLAQCKQVHATLSPGISSIILLHAIPISQLVNLYVITPDPNFALQSN